MRVWLADARWVWFPDTGWSLLGAVLTPAGSKGGALLFDVSVQTIDEWRLT